MTSQSALVIFSGGQDSTTCLYWAKNHFDSIQALTFNYGQKHDREIECAVRIAEKAGIPHHITRLSFFEEQGVSTLIKGGKADFESDLPDTFIPGRNIIFLTHAAVIAYKAGIHDLVIGVSQVDYSGYPDCREETIRSTAKTLSLGLDYPINIHTPLINLTKAETVQLAEAEGALEIMALTHTCYKGLFPPCGDCDACKLRVKGFLDAGIPDPLME